jgi:methionyl-tRNA synthetase
MPRNYNQNPGACPGSIKNSLALERCSRYRVVMDLIELRKKIEEDRDFVNLSKYGFSLKKLLEKFPEGGVPDNIAAKALGISEEELEDLYQQTVARLRVILAGEIK